MERGTNQPLLGDYNQSVILDVIRRSGDGISRAQLARRTGLTAQTITRIIRKLLAEGLLLEGAPVQPVMGRPSVLLTLDPSGGYAVGVHLDPTTMTYVLLDARGGLVSRATAPTPEADAAIETVACAVEALIDGSGIGRDQIVGVGIAAPGPLDAASGVLVDPPNMPPWSGVPLRTALHARLGLPVLLDKDVIAAAVAEKWSRPDSPGSFVFVYLGAGIGVGTVVGGEVVRGVSGNAGEMGHFGTGEAEPSCSAGHVGCVGFSCVPWAMVSEAKRAGILDGPDPGRTDAPGAEREFARLCSLAASGVTGAREILDRSARRVAKVATDLANLLDVDRVVLGGPLWPSLADRYLDIVPPLVREGMVTRGIHEVEVQGTVVGTDVGAVGGACLVLDAHFSPRRSALVLS